MVYIVDRSLTGYFETHGPTRILIESTDPRKRAHESCIPLTTSEWDGALAEFHRREAILLGREAP